MRKQPTSARNANADCRDRSPPPKLQWHSRNCRCSSPSVINLVQRCGPLRAADHFERMTLRQASIPDTKTGVETRLQLSLLFAPGPRTHMTDSAKMWITSAGCTLPIAPPESSPTRTKQRARECISAQPSGAIRIGLVLTSRIQSGQSLARARPNDALRIA
jgi:hypothetical protein